jgi:hypothetical protein
VAQTEILDLEKKLNISQLLSQGKITVSQGCFLLSDEFHSSVASLF